MRCRYWAIAIPSIFLMIVIIVIFGYIVIVGTYVVSPNDYRIYTDTKKSEVTKQDFSVIHGENSIVPIEDCDIGMVSEMVYN